MLYIFLKQIDYVHTYRVGIARVDSRESSLEQTKTKRRRRGRMPMTHGQSHFIDKNTTYL